ncbi:methyltransferase GidB [gamma proteobacterium HTCC5015]|nr:methyltransferase GidB [gamma proteobacterium HTCC5015]
MSVAERLQTGLEVLCQSSVSRGFAPQFWLDDGKVTAWRDYLALLEKWNKAYNLTAVRDPSKMVSHHLLDSLAIAPFIQGECILDVGTGAGLPGIPLAIAFPEWQFTLLDSNGKKTRFVSAAKRELGLTNVDVVQARVETLAVERGFDTITSRAFSELQPMMEWTQHLLAPNGRIAAMKGPRAEQELAPIRASIQDLAIESVDVPGLEGQRFMVCFQPRNHQQQEA